MANDKDVDNLKGMISLIILLIIIYVLSIIYTIIVTYWMWLLLLLIIGIIGWIYPQKDTNKIQDSKKSQPIMISNLEKEQTNESKSYINKKSNDSSLNNNEKNYNKGCIFEQYVINLFDDSYFSIYDCTRDNSKHFNRKVESDQNPDITMRYIPKNELFSIECKFRSSAYDEKVNWARNDQIINYLSYAAKNRRPTFVVIGLGGSPDNPNRMFCLPIEEAKYPDIFISKLRRYERNPSVNFFWKRGNLI